MSIQAQCEKCSDYIKSIYGMKCQRWNKNPYFDEKECPYFAEKKVEEVVEHVEEKNEIPQLKSPEEILKYASEQYIEFNVSDEFLRKDLISKGVPEENVDTVLAQARGLYKQHNRASGRKSIFNGIIAIFAGFAYLFISYFLFRGIGSIITWGIWIWGIVEIILGLVRIIRNRP